MKYLQTDGKDVNIGEAYKREQISETSNLVPIATGGMNLCVCLILVSIWTSCSSEPECSRFHYEEKTLEKIIKTEFVVDKLKSELKESDGTTKAELEKIRTDLEKINSELVALKERYDESRDSEKMKNLKGFYVPFVIL